MWLIGLIREPYPFHTIRQEFKKAVIIAFFVFGFLTFFQPFGLGGNLLNLIKVTVVYGMITFIAIILLHFLLRKFFPAFFNERNWTFGKELLITLILFSVIGSINLLFTNYRFGLNLTLVNFFWFQLNTFAVGFFPVVFFMLINYTRLLKENTINAQQLSVSFMAKRNPLVDSGDNTLIIKSELKSDDLLLSADNFLFAESADNYLLISFLENGIVKKKLVRTTLSKLEIDFSAVESMLRCHRAFFINLNHVESFKGNAQGLQVKLKWIATEVPVSRKMVPAIKKHFS